LLFVQPGAQQPSPLLQVVIGALLQAASQVAAVPVRASVVQALLSLHEVLQLPSQVSPGSITPLPHLGPQSTSVFALHCVAMQQVSTVLPLQVVIALLAHSTLHLSALPVSASVVQLLLSLQVVGQLPSQVSPGSTWPSPQRGAGGAQSLSFAFVQPGAQQPSPPLHAVIATFEQTALQVAALPDRASVVHAF
jgi:hypothetical protein